MAAPKGVFKCPKCDRKFSMAAHLARHTSTIHSSTRGKGGSKAKAMRRGGFKGIGRRTGQVGRPSGPAARLGLRTMTIEQLVQVIDSARDEARLKLADLERTFA